MVASDLTVVSLVGRLGLPRLIRHCKWRRERRIVQAHLEGRRFMAPTLRNQSLWARHLCADQVFDPSASAWQILQRFSRPLLESYGSQAHRTGIKALGLCDDQPPDKNIFVEQVLRQTGWRIVASNGELPPQEFFSLLRDRVFPCVFQVRPVHEVFCGSQPDFWHEAVGHISALCDPRVAEFYRRCGQLVCEARKHNDPDKARRLEQVLWVLLEYGLLNEGGRIVAFGAALAGSFMALQRFQRGYNTWASVDLDRIIDSRLYEDGAKIQRDPRGRVQFYCIEDFKALIDQLHDRFLAPG